MGRNIYAYVKTQASCVKIHICHYRQPTNTKGGRLVALDLNEFLRLLKVQKYLTTDYNQHMSSLFVLQEKNVCSTPRTEERLYPANTKKRMWRQTKQRLDPQDQQRSGCRDNWPKQILRKTQEGCDTHLRAGSRDPMLNLHQHSM